MAAVLRIPPCTGAWSCFACKLPPFFCYLWSTSVNLFSYSSSCSSSFLPASLFIFLLFYLFLLFLFLFFFFLFVFFWVGVISLHYASSMWLLSCCLVHVWLVIFVAPLPLFFIVLSMTALNTTSPANGLWEDILRLDPLVYTSITKNFIFLLLGLYTPPFFSSLQAVYLSATPIEDNILWVFISIFVLCFFCCCFLFLFVCVCVFTKGTEL